MKNNRPLGPLPTDPAEGPAVSAAQRSVLQELTAAGAPTTLVALARRSGLHENTLRAHLGALARAGLVRTERSAPSGRGRPALLWAAVPGAGSHAVEYAGLATALARTVARTSSRPAEDAADAGRSWGDDLAREDGGTDARTRLRSVLTRLGFGPEESPPESPEPVAEGRPAAGIAGPVGSVLRLTRCPLLDVARELPEVVCNVHRGLVEGVLEPGRGSGPAAVDVRLAPFAEPGACVLTLAPPPPGRSR